MAETTNGTATKAKFLLGVFAFIGPTILSMAAGYGTARATMSSMEQRVLTAERDISELKINVNYNRDHFISREAWEIYTEGQNRYMADQGETLKQIQKDMWALRQGK